MSLINTLRGKTSDTTTQIARIDAATHSLQTVDYAYHEVHAGSAYFYRDSYTIAKGGTKNFLLVTPNTTEWAHFNFRFEAATSQVTAYIYEDTTTSADGSIEPVRNRNRNVADDNTTELYENPTIVGIGNKIKQSTFGAGKNSEGGSSRDDSEIVLKQNTKYLIQLIEANILETIVNVSFDWYEHTNKTA